LAGEFALAAADTLGTAVTAVGVCCTEVGWAPGRVLAVVSAAPPVVVAVAPAPYGVATGVVVVVVVSAWAGPDEKATSPKMATAPTRAAGAARRALSERRGEGVVT
jgi:hypothetical protein